MANGDVPEDGAANSAADGSDGGDEAAWLDLVARFDAPGAGDEAPWPEREDLRPRREDLPGAVRVTPAGPEDEHYVPPPPPPLPKLRTATKLAWLALFAGPCYLLVCTIVGWPVSGLAAFLCVAVFVGGFAVLVLRMDNGGPGDSGPGDGAVV